jgi:CheY-specific phosphatase CheX
MLGMESDEVGSYCSAGVAELLNMIVGSAKQQLSETESRFEMSIPKVAENAKMPVTNDTGLPSVWIRCGVGDEHCHILVTMKGVDDGV